MHSHFREGSEILHEMWHVVIPMIKGRLQGAGVSHPAQSCSPFLNILSVLKWQRDLVLLRQEIWCD